MHYYKFNIADWQSSVRHLTPEEEGVYFRLINHYYDTEKPIPLETQSVMRRLMLGSHLDIVDAILAEFFIKTDRGYEKEKCNEIIKEYKKTANKNKKNGALGGRPKKHKASEETQSVSSGLPDETQEEPKDNPNQELLTINHKPLTNLKESGQQVDLEDAIANAKPPPKKYDVFDYRLAEHMFSQIAKVAPKTKKPNLEKWADVIRLMREQDGHQGQEIADIFTWANKDGFWSTNILSPSKLRTQYSKLHAQKMNPRPSGYVNAQQAAAQSVAYTERLDSPEDLEF